MHYDYSNFEVVVGEEHIVVRAFSGRGAALKGMKMLGVRPPPGSRREFLRSIEAKRVF